MTALDERLDTLLGLYANPPGTDIRAVGPCDYDEIASRLAELRSTVYAREMPYLLSGDALALEDRLRIDERALHFCAIAPDESIVGSLRVTPEPLELPHLCDCGAELSAMRPRHGEITRLVIHRAHRRQNLMARLFAVMAQSIMRTGETDGLLAVAKPAGVRSFGTFGFTPVVDSRLALVGRPTADYRVISATFAVMMEAGQGRLGTVGADLAAT